MNDAYKKLNDFNEDENKILHDLTHFVNNLFEELKMEGVKFGANIVIKGLMTFKNEVKEENPSLEELLELIENRMKIEFKIDQVNDNNNIYYINKLILKIFSSYSKFLEIINKDNH